MELYPALNRPLGHILVSFYQLLVHLVKCIIPMIFNPKKPIFAMFYIYKMEITHASSYMCGILMF